MRLLAAVLLSCALFSVVVLTSLPSEAYAKGYDASGQAVVETPIEVVPGYVGAVDAY